MATSREQFIKEQNQLLDEVFAFAPGEQAARLSFERLAISIYDHPDRVERWMSPLPLKYAPFLQWRKAEGTDYALPAPLAELWRSWLKTYEEITTRNPPLALYYAMREISETNDASSWPIGLERNILKWIDDGGSGAFPFYDRYGLVTEEFFQRLKAAREKSDGWLFWDHELKKIVYAPWDMWDERCREQDRLNPPSSRP